MIICPTCQHQFPSYPEFTAHIGNPTCANEIVAPPTTATEPRHRQWTVRGNKPPFQVCDPYGNLIATVHTTIESAEGIATAMNNRMRNTTAAIRKAIFTALDNGDPERGGDEWALDENWSKDGAVVSEEDATENRWRFVEQVIGQLKAAMTEKGY